MKKFVPIFLVFSLVLLCCACQRKSSALDPFAEIEGDQQTGYSIKNIPWGSSADEIKKMFPKKEFTDSPGIDRIIHFEETDEYDRAIIFIFLDHTLSSLVSAEYAYMPKTQEAYDEIINALYQSALKNMSLEGISNSDALQDVRQFQQNLFWQAEDNSYVYFALSDSYSNDNLNISVKVTMPREPWN